MTPEEIEAIAGGSPAVKALGDNFRKLSEKFANINWILTVLVVALFIGFAGTFIAATAMLVDSYNYKTGSILRLENKIDDQQKSINRMNDFLDSLEVSEGTGRPNTTQSPIYPER